MVPTAPEWSFACPDWKERLRDGRSLVPDLPLDRKLASRAVGIFNNLRLPDVTGEPYLREAGGDWQRDIVAALFGSLRSDGLRMVKNLFVLVPKKNSKTTTAAAIMLTAMLLDKDPRQEYLIFAPSHAIAELGFNAARGMIEADEELSKRFHIREHLKLIEDLKTKSTLRIKTFDSSIATGIKPKGILIDELHEIGKMHFAEKVMQQLSGGLASRRDGFMVIITTQSDDPPAGVFKQELKLARDIRDGKAPAEAALATLPVLYEFPEEIQADRSHPWQKTELWGLVLPNLGKSCHLDLLRQDFAKAKEKGEGPFRIWASQHLNIQIGLGLHDERWRGADYWERAAFEPIRDLDVLFARSEVAVVGIDGGGLDDLTGLSVCGRDAKTGVWLYWFHAWAHRNVCNVRKDIAPRLYDFEKAGDLTFWGDPDNPPCVAEILAEEGDAASARLQTDEDVVAIVAICARVRDAGLLPKQGGIGFDRASIGAVGDALAAEGFSLTAGDEWGTVEAVSQSAVNMNSAITTLERKLESGGAAHGGTEMMNWCVGNAKAVQRGNSVAIDKQVSGKAKIDPLVAGFIATKLMERTPEAASDGVNDWLASLRTAA